MLLLNNYDLGGYIQHFRDLRERGLIPSDGYIFTIRQFFTDAECNTLEVTMLTIMSDGQGGVCRVLIKNDDQWTTTLLTTRDDIDQAVSFLRGRWVRVWDQQSAASTDSEPVWGLLSATQPF